MRTTIPKRLITIVTAVIAVAAIAVAYVAIKNRPPAPFVESSYEKVRVLQLEEEEIQRIEINSEERTLVLEQKDGVWTIDYPYEIELDNMHVDDVVSNFTSLWAEEIVEEQAQDIGQYGLEKPAVVATAFLADQTAAVIHLGDRTPVRNTYYLKVEGDPKVYAVWMNHAKY